MHPPVKKGQQRNLLRSSAHQTGIQWLEPFSQKAIDPLFRGSNGIPRLINMLAHKGLMVAFGRDDYALNGKCIELAVEDTGTL